MLHRRGDPGQVGEGRGAALKPAGHARRGGRELIRVQGLEQGRFADHSADVRPGPLVGAGGVEVGTERPDVDRHMRGGVHAVDVDQRADRVCGRGDGRHVRPGADDVAGRGDRDQPGALGQQVAVLGGRQLSSRCVDFGPAHRGTAARGGLHPGPDVRVVVEPRHDHLVARPPAPGQRLGEPVGEGGHVRAEDDAVRAGAGQVGQGLAAFGHDGAGAPAGGEGAPDVADPGPVGVRDRLDDRRGDLRARGTVQVCVAVAQCRVDRPDALYVKGHESKTLLRCRAGLGAAAACSSLLTSGASLDPGLMRSAGNARDRRRPIR